MKVSNMTSQHGNEIANQFIIKTSGRFKNEEGQMKKSVIECFQSYDSTIAKIVTKGWRSTTYLDKRYWDYSVTTGKYRNQFLGENKADTQRKIDSGEYKLVDLNK